MDKYRVTRRSIAEAVYTKNNPNGDPFKYQPPKTKDELLIYGIGLGLYWGEGTKANRHSVRIGNSDPKLILSFIIFLEKIFCIRKSDLRFSLQLFSDINPSKALRYWISAIKVNRSQFTQSTISLSHKKGTYRKKSTYGVLTLYYHNKKLRDLLISHLHSIKK